MKADKSQPRKFSLRKRLGSFRFAWNGVRHALVQEHNFRIHFLASLLVIAAGFFFGVTPQEWLALIFAMGFVLVAELFNTAIELLADFVFPGAHPTIGKIKDIAAGAVLVAVIAAVAAAAIVFFPYVCALAGYPST